MTPKWSINQLFLKIGYIHPSTYTEKQLFHILQKKCVIISGHEGFVFEKTVQTKINAI